MLKVRLKRIGKKGQPFYRVVVMESTRNRSSKAVEDLGSYNPHTKPGSFNIDTERAKYWLSKGAQPTDTVAQHFVKSKLIKSLKKGSTKPKGRAKKKQPKES